MSNARPNDDVYPRDLYQDPRICPLTKAPVGQDLRLCQLQCEATR